MGALDTYLFDLDGTLIDSIELILRCYELTALDSLDEPPSREYFRQRIGIPLVGVFGELAPAERIPELVTRYREHNAELHDAMVTPFEGVVDMVQTLASRGHRLAVVTSKQREAAEHGLRVAGLADAFEFVIGAYCVTNHKPHPEPVLTALARLDRHASRAIYIGDSPYDIESGRRAEARTAAVLWGPYSAEELEPARPDHVIARPEELLDL